MRTLRLRTLPLLCAAALLRPAAARAAALDLSLDYRVRSLSYSNVSMDPALKHSDDFISERARVGFVVKKIQLETVGGVESSMEVGLVLQALNVAGSTQTLPAPFDRAAGRYPATDYQPFVENAYLKVFHAAGSSWDATIGRQPAMLGNGLVVSDDGLGFTGVSAKRSADRWGAQAFYFQPRANGTNGSQRFHLAGAAMDIPMDGILTLSDVLEADHTGGVEAGVPIQAATRHFPGVRYAVRTDQFAFEGEAVAQRGTAKPIAPGAKKIKYSGEAGVLSALWRQDLGRFGTGIARMTVAEGSGDDPASPNRNEAFQPSFGHRFDGLERDGWGDLFGATPYDAIGPSTTTANGLPAGISGLRVVRVGITLPEFRRVRTDLDYYLFRASKTSSSASLGHETDIRLTYAVKDRLLFRASAAIFTPGRAMGPSTTTAKRLAFEVSGKF